MLSRLELTNWRSFKNVVIEDLTPITVLIGANSSGKSNLIDALYFLRDAQENGVLQALQDRGGVDKVRAVNAAAAEAVEIKFTYKPKNLHDALTYSMGIKTNNTPLPDVAEKLEDDNGVVWLESAYEDSVWIRDEPGTTHPITDAPFGWDETVLSSFNNALYPKINQTYQFVTERWQLLDENFMPPLYLSSGATGDFIVIDKCADNVPQMLDFMQKVHPTLYQQMQEDLQWLLHHVESVEVDNGELEYRLFIKEKNLQGREAPTISAGSARIVAILAACYSLDAAAQRYVDLPSLIVIEEPDASIHPLLFKRLVELLRSYTDGEHPRQFILTTHNPALLNLFEPDEVRIVERNKDGESTVSRIPEQIREIWLDEYGLGEVWMTRSLGGVPE